MLYQIQTRILKFRICCSSAEDQKLRGRSRRRGRHVEVQIREFLQFLKGLHRRREYRRHPSELILVLVISGALDRGSSENSFLGPKVGQLGRGTVSVWSVGEDGELVVALAGLHRQGARLDRTTGV